MSALQRRAPGVMRMPVRYSRTLLIRGTAVWVMTRLMVLALYALIAAGADAEISAAFTQSNPLVLSGWTLALSAAVMLLDLHRRHEIALLGNLGVLVTHAVALGTVPAVVMETALAIVR
jgi:hypothetical protein